MMMWPGFCRRLDGIPLAIELAAARVRVLTVEQIAARLDSSFQLLAAGSRTALARHQTLRATIDWSYVLLTEQEVRLFRRLSLFAGGWTLEAAEAVCAGDGIAKANILDLLSHHVDKSLVVMQAQEGRARYRLLETVRQKLVEAGESETLRRRHAGFFLRLAEEIEPKINSRDRAAWLALLEADHDNLRAALRWAEETREETVGLRLAGQSCGSGSTGAIGAKGGAETPVSNGARAKALYGAGWLPFTQGDHGSSSWATGGERSNLAGGGDTAGPVLGQGANLTSRCAWLLGEALLEDRAIDEAFCQEVEGRLWQAGQVATLWTNLMLQPPPPHMIQLLVAAAQSQAIADELAENFNMPKRNWEIFGSLEGVERLLEQHGVTMATMIA